MSQDTLLHSSIRAVDDMPNRVPEGLPITDEGIAQRKAFLEFEAEDERRLKDVNEIARRYADAVIDDFYTHLMAFEDTAAYFRDSRVLRRVKNLQKQYFLRLTEGEYDRDYVQNRVNIGAVHERIGLPVNSYLGMYNFYLRAVASKLMEAFPKKPDVAVRSFLSLMKLTFLDIGLAIDTYIHSRERTIREQQEAIRELPTPVLPFREGMLIVPIIGLLDSQRARQLTEQLLESVRVNRAKVVVIDITGVQAVDSKVANHIVQTVEAARLMGTKMIIAGISPPIAQTMVTLGIDLGWITTVGDLQAGVERAERLLGYKMVKLDNGVDEGEGA